MDALATFRQEWSKELSSGSNRVVEQKYPETAQLSDSPDCANNSDRNVSAAFATAVPMPSSSYNTLNVIQSLSRSKDDLNVLCSSTKMGLDRDLSYSQNDTKRRMIANDQRTGKKRKIKGLKDLFWEKKKGEIPEERLLDKLIADIDEITAIPFFDISLPKEVAVKIFQHLDIKDLCSCAQVSKSWQVLAEDELLWCRLCHRMGQETIYTTRDKRNWKQIVQHNVERHRLLVSNWKGRVGKLTQLEHIKGKILCAVDSIRNIVVAGYTNGEVKLWDLDTEDSCVFQPASTALVLDDYQGTVAKIVNSVVTSSTVTAASYTQGNVDIWSLEAGTRPVQTYCPDKRGQYSPTLCISPDGSTLCVSYGRYIDLLYREPGCEQYRLIQQLDNTDNVKHVKLYETGATVPGVMFAKSSTVNLYNSTQPDVIGSESHMATIHDQIYAPIEALDFKSDQSVLGVALPTYSTVKLYDIPTCRLLGMMDTNSWVTCINLQQSPPHELVTGSRDRKVCVFDERQMACVQTFLTHGGVRCVQMDEWKVVSGGHEGFICVWDRRMNTKLWEWHNRHPVCYVNFHDKDLIVGNIATTKTPEMDEFEFTTHKRYRGSVHVYNFLEDLTTRDVPEICLSTYDQPDASRYNIGLAMPYDTLQF